MFTATSKTDLFVHCRCDEFYLKEFIMQEKKHRRFIWRQEQ